MGCKSTKHASQPGTKPGKGMTPQKSPGKRYHEPAKSPMKALKQLPEAELRKHKESDIVAFVRAGQLSMVHGLINHYKLGVGVMQLRDVGHEITVLRGERAHSSTFNPLLIAVANKKIDVVQYFLNELKVSLKHSGRKPGEEVSVSEELAAEQQIFCLELAIMNKDIHMLEELWSHFTAWDTMHLIKIVNIIVSENLHHGLSAILKSSTTDSIFSSLPYNSQVNLLQQWFTMRKTANPEMKKAFDESLGKSPFSLMSIYVLLEDTQDRLMEPVEIRAFVDRAHGSFTEYEYAHMKYSIMNTQLRQRIVAFEGLGDPEKVTMKGFNTVLDNYDQKFDDHRYFKSEGDYENVELEALQAYQTGDKERVTQLLAQTDIRRVPLTPGYNHSLRYPELNNYPYTFWPLPLVMIYTEQVSDEPTIIEFFHTLIYSGFNIRQALRLQQHKDYENQNPNNDPVMDGAALLIALERGKFAVFEYLLGADFVNVWSAWHLRMVLNVIVREGRNDLITMVLNSLVAKNIFVGFPEERKHEFVRNTHQMFAQNDFNLSQARIALSQKPYSRYLLLLLINRDNFRKMTDFAPYVNCINEVSRSELEAMSNEGPNEELFMDFMRYVQMLEPSDQRKLEGQKLIDRCYDLPRFQALKNASLQIFDHESVIQDEDHFDDEAHRVHVNTISAHPKAAIRDLDINILYQQFRDGLQYATIEYLRAYKPTDLLFFRGDASENYATYRFSEDRQEFEQIHLSGNNFNILQIACFNGHYDLVRYIMLEHKTFSNTRQTRAMDPRIVLINHFNENHENLTLRLAIQSGSLEIFKLLWDSYPRLYTEKHLSTIARFCIFLRKYEFLVHLLSSPTSTPIFLSSSEHSRSEFVDLFDQVALDQTTEKTAILQILGQEPYTRLHNTIPESRLQQIFSYIRNNEIDNLKDVIKATEIQGIAHLIFDVVVDNEEVLVLADDSTLNVSFLNPILLAAKCKSFDCLTYLVNTFGVRQSMRSYPLQVKTGRGEFTYSNLMIPIVMKGRDNDILAFLLKAEGFFINSIDFNSIISQAISDRWFQGLKTFLWSNTAQFLFTAMSWEDQKNVIFFILRTIVEMEDIKMKQQFILNVIEDPLTKRPYVKHLTTLILEGDLIQTLDLSRITLECLKNLTSEDFMQIYYRQPADMLEYEKRYQQIAGTTYESELAKIILRYQNEGKPANFAAGRKQVTFQEGSHVQYSEVQ